MNTNTDPVFRGRPLRTSTKWAGASSTIGDTKVDRKKFGDRTAAGWHCVTNPTAAASPCGHKHCSGRAKPLKHERFRNPTGREVHPEARQPVAITAGPWARLSIATAPVSGAWGRRL